ncbi:methyltransferase domain-containing protein [uncultured Wocania sp.]|uniref:class I SAM-dependent methyltransferase n=1 Tax=uncultured Wocania sp. TaxID=2834404 RepID=UPI0030FBE8EA
MDAGFGSGRNLKWFYPNDFEIFGIDADSQFLANAKLKYPEAASHFTVGTLDDLPFNKKKK